MLEKIKIDNGILYQLIGEIYYPVFDDQELELGIFAKKKIEYLISNNLICKDKVENNKQFRYEMFRYNCLCEQLCQSIMDQYINDQMPLNRLQMKYKYQEIQQKIIDTYVLPIDKESDNG